MTENIIWQAILDDKFSCAVVRIGEREGNLVVANDETKEVLLDRVVPLSYGAQFGPDVADVAYWQELIVEVVDGSK